MQKVTQLRRYRNCSILGAWVLLMAYCVLSASRTGSGKDKLDVLSLLYSGLLLGIAAIVLIWRTDKIEKRARELERFKAVFGFSPEEPITFEKNDRVNKRMNTLRGNLSAAMEDLENVPKEDVLRAEAMQAYVSALQKQLRDLLVINRKFQWGCGD